MQAPRWRLTLAHYLNVRELPDGTRVEWEHKETNRENGRMVRKLFQVPMLLNPEAPEDCNYPGQIIVAHEVEGARNEPQDIIFTGAPTNEMEPLNEAAQAISDSMREKWLHPIDTLPVNGGMSEKEQMFMEQMMKAFAGAGAAQNQSVPKAQYDELQERLARLEALLADQNKPKPEAGIRRV